MKNGPSIPSLLRFGILGFLLVIALAGCGSGVGAYQVSSDFKPYVEKFQSDASSNGKAVEIHSLVVEFGETGSAAGKCLRNFMEPPTIYVHKELWDNISEQSRTILIYHELGHCILDKQHNPDVAHDEEAGDYPVSLMNPVMVDDLIFEQRRDYYVSELFN